MKLSEKDIKKLKKLGRFISDGTACSYDKSESLEILDSVLNPKCVVCRKPLDEGMVIVNGKKMHEKCSKRYKT